VVNANTGGPSGTAVLVQADTTAALALLATAQIGEGADNGSGVHPKLYQPAFSNSYYNSPATGLITVCGTGPADTTPYQYEFGFFARTMNTTSPLLAQQLSTSQPIAARGGRSSSIPTPVQSTPSRRHRSLLTSWWSLPTTAISRWGAGSHPRHGRKLPERSGCDDPGLARPRADAYRIHGVLRRRGLH